MKKFSRLRIDVRAALLYALFGGLWILLSDRLLASLIQDPASLTTLQTYKGWTYVLLSALLIYALLRRELSLRHIVEVNFDKSGRVSKRSTSFNANRVGILTRMSPYTGFANPLLAKSSRIYPTFTN